MSARDPYDVLVAAGGRDHSWHDPVDLDHDSVAAAILRRVLADTVVVDLDRRRRRRRWAVGVVTIGVLAAGSAVAANTWTRQAPATVRALACWNQVPMVDGVIIGTRFGDEDPIETCRQVWDDPSHAAHRPGDDLVICVADYGTAIVIPGHDDTDCDAAGLARFDGRIDPEAFAIRDVENDVAHVLSRAGTCLEVDDAVAIVHDALATHGLDHWDVTVSHERPWTDDVCAVFAFDEDTRTAIVNNIPNLWDTTS